MSTAGRPVRRPYRRIEIGPAGSGVAAAAAVAWVAGALLGYPSLVLMAAAALLALVAAAGFVLWKPLMGVEREFHPATVTAGDTAIALLTVTNRSTRHSPPVTVTDHLGHAGVNLPVRGLPPGGTHVVRYSLPTERRGRIVLGPLLIERSDPFGLLRRRQDHGALDILWVHPRTHPMSPLPAGVLMDLEGPLTETSPPGTVTFSSLREYVPGDDRRHIHWRSSARLGVLMVRHHVDADEPRATIMLDARNPGWADDSFEAGVEVAASVARALTLEGHPTVLEIAGEEPLEGLAGIGDRLAAIERSPVADPAALLAGLEHGSGGGALVVVSAPLEPVLEARITALRNRYAPIVLCSIGPDLPTRWARRSGITVVQGRTAAAVARVWDSMVRH